MSRKRNWLESLVMALLGVVTAVIALCLMF